MKKYWVYIKSLYRVEIEAINKNDAEEKVADNVDSYINDEYLIDCDLDGCYPVIENISGEEKK